MKQISKILSIFILTSLLLNVMVVPAPVLAAEEEDGVCYDNQIINATHADYLILGNTLQQVFTFNHNVLSGVQIEVQTMPLDFGSGVTGELRRSSDNVLLSTADTTIWGTGKIWLTFDFPDISITPGTELKILPRTMAPGTVWLYSVGANCYAGGYAVKNGMIENTKDFGFTSYGHNTGSPPPPVNPGTNPSARSTASNNQTSSNTNSIQTVQKPAITKVAKNDQEADLKKNEILALRDGDRLTVSGMTTIGTSVALVIGSDNFETKVNNKGEWATTLDVKVLKRGEFTIQAKAAKDGKESELASSIKIKVSDLVKVIIISQEESWWERFMKDPYILAGFGVLLALLVILLVLFEKHYHGLARIFKRDKKTKTKTKV